MSASCMIVGVRYASTLLFLLILALASVPARAEASPATRALAALDCVQAAADAGAMLACAAPLRDIGACLLRGEGTASCLPMAEAGLIGLCATVEGGFSVEVLAACLALRMTLREAAKCFAVGIGVSGGCLGPSNTLRQWGEAGLATWRAREDLWSRRPMW